MGREKQVTLEWKEKYRRFGQKGCS